VDKCSQTFFNVVARRPSGWLTLRHEELSPFIWGLQVYFRVAVKPDGTVAGPIVGGRT
jgi:hypothetical protein